MVRRLVDPAVEAHGFPVTSVYFETVVLPILGPTSVLLMRRLATWLEASPDGIHVDLATLAADLGLSRGTTRNSPIRRTITRICRMAEWRHDALAVRTVIAPLKAHQLARLSPASSPSTIPWSAAPRHLSPGVPHRPADRRPVAPTGPADRSAHRVATSDHTATQPAARRARRGRR